MKLTRFTKNIPPKKWNRFIILLIIITAVSVLAGFIGLFLLARSQTLPQKVTQNDCTSCHAEIYAGWHNNAHGDIQSKHALAEESNCTACHKIIPVTDQTDITTGSTMQGFSINAGSPNHCLGCHASGYDQTTKTWKSEGVTCESCHGVIPKDHPDSAVKVDKSTENCRTCHSDDRFDWGEWEGSVHYKNSITCVNCHNPHTTSLKVVGEGQSDSSQLCKNCHQKLAQTYEHSIHMEIGVACADCHFSAPKGNDDFHKVVDHDFKAKIESCNKCHADQMHTIAEPNITRKIIGIAHASGKPRKDISTVLENAVKTLSTSNGLVMTIILLGMVSGGVLRKRFYK